MGLRSEIMEEQNVQVEDALRKWYAFKNGGKIPAVDQFEDDHNTFWNVYGKEFKSDDGVKYKNESGWDELLKVIAGWSETLQQAEMLEPQMLQMQQMIKQGQAPMDEQIMAYQALPKAMEDRIYFVWTQMVNAKQDPMQAFKLDHPFVKMKAVAEAHRIYDERKTAMAQQTPTAAAPGAEATPEGTEPTQGQPGMVQ